MSPIRFTALLLTAASSILTAIPAATHPASQSVDADFTVSNSALNAIFNLDPDFFDRGYDLFEAEIDRLVHQGLEFDEMLLTIDAIEEFDPERLEQLKIKSISPDRIVIPEVD